MDIYCISCGSKMPGTASFCASCGTEVYRPKPLPRETDALEQSFPSTPLATEPSYVVRQNSVTSPPLDVGAKEQNPKNAVKSVAYAAVALYLTVVVAALLLHQHANAEAMVVRDLEESQAQLADLVFNRAQRSPRMLQLLKWPEGASDNSVDGFISRCDELAPLLSNELSAGKRVHEHALQVLARVPTENPNHARAALVAQAAEDDVHLYESLLLEISLADKARLKSPAMRAEFINSGLVALHNQENADLKHRQETIEQLQ